MTCREIQAFDLRAESYLKLKNINFTKCTTGNGRYKHLIHVTYRSELKLMSCEFTEIESQSGAIYVDQEAKLEAKMTRFVNNKAMMESSCINCKWKSNINLTDCEFVEHKSDNVYKMSSCVIKSEKSKINIALCTFENNKDEAYNHHLMSLEVNHN